MAIVRMQKLSICANKKNRKAILEFLQSLGAVEIFTDAIDDEDLRRKDTQAARSSFERSADSFDKVLKLLNTYAPGKKQGMALFAGKDSIKREDYDRVVSNIRSYLEDSTEILRDEKELIPMPGKIL